MKTKISIFIILISSIAICQTATVEKSIFTVQTGIFGAWVNNETRLTNQIALKSEVGLDATVFGGEQYSKTGFIFTPVLNVEPRWYYNLNRRVSKNKTIYNNSGNYAALSLNHHPDWFVISNTDGVVVYPSFAIVPKYGLKRTIGSSNFNYEFSAGIGFQNIYREKYGYKNVNDTFLDLSFRIGYTFK